MNLIFNVHARVHVHVTLTIYSPVATIRIIIIIINLISLNEFLFTIQDTRSNRYFKKFNRADLMHLKCKPLRNYRLDANHY